MVASSFFLLSSFCLFEFAVRNEPGAGAGAAPESESHEYTFTGIIRRNQQKKPKQHTQGKSQKSLWKYCKDW